MNKFKNMNKKKSFWGTFVNEFLGTVLITSIIIYITVFILLGRAGLFNFLGCDNNIINGLTAASLFPIVLVLVFLAITLAVYIVGLIPLTIHKIKAVYNYTYLPLTVDEIKAALNKNIISSKEDYIKLILDSLRYGVTNKPSSFFSTYYIAFSKEELYSLCKAFEKVFDSPIIIDGDVLSYLNKYDCYCSPFDEAEYEDEASLITIRTRRQEYENEKDTTFAIYTDGDKYKNILETVNFPLYVGKK